MKVFYNKSFQGVCPTGVCAIVVAPNVDFARIHLTAKLYEIGLKQEVKNEDFIEIDLEMCESYIVNKGDY